MVAVGLVIGIPVFPRRLKGIPGITHSACAIHVDVVAVGANGISLSRAGLVFREPFHEGVDPGTLGDAIKIHRPSNLRGQWPTPNCSHGGLRGFFFVHTIPPSRMYTIIFLSLGRGMF